MNNKEIAKLHYITQDMPEFTHEQLAEEACKGGANWIQLRVKNKPYDEWLAIAERTKEICNKYNAKLIVNDNIEITKAVNAAGVHLGKKDTNPREARKQLGENFIIGGTANSLEEIKKLYACEVDYIGVGPYKFTSTKQNLSPILGIYGLKNLITAISYIHLNENNTIPLIAIGGINTEDIALIMNSGVHGIAVSSAIGMAEDKQQATKEFLNELL